MLNADDDLLPTAQIPGRLRPVWFGIRSSSADVRAINIHTVGEGTGFTLVDNVDGETYEFSVTIPTAGVHTVYDALAAYTAATRLGLERARAARALASYQTTGMRQNIVQHGGVTFIEDCYNASPDSMKAALQILHDRQPGPGRIAVLGDMLELALPVNPATARPANGRRCRRPAGGLRPVERSHGRSSPAERAANHPLPSGGGSSRISTAERPPRRCCAGKSQPRHEAG